MEEKSNRIIKYSIYILILINFILTHIETKDIDLSYKTSTTGVLQFRLLLPIVICLAIILFRKKTTTNIVKTICSVPFLVLGTNWFVVFSFTNYRLHWKYPMILMSIILLLIFTILNNTFFNIDWKRKKTN